MYMRLSVTKVLEAYRRGYFPMADPQTGRIWWFSPDPRAVLPLAEFHVPRSVARLVRRGVFEVYHDRAFDAVVAACADRSESWLSKELQAVYRELYRVGHAHSVECWQEGQLVGGLFGIAIGGAFFGESMFHRVTGASKVALVHLVTHLRWRGFRLLDIQFLTPHFLQFGAEEISRHLFEKQLAEALALPVHW
ncbi:Leucyl/phenylalanyl-tRNA--protein transferase [bacterium HR18]|nr:Leucyl/phenylalanyl-tRNA--protein transferase [bacterium HR18]